MDKKDFPSKRFNIILMEVAGLPLQGSKRFSRKFYFTRVTLARALFSSGALQQLNVVSLEVMQGAGCVGSTLSELNMISNFYLGDLGNWVTAAS